MRFQEMTKFAHFPPFFQNPPTRIGRFFCEGTKSYFFNKMPILNAKHLNKGTKYSGQNLDVFSYLMVVEPFL